MVVGSLSSSFYGIPRSTKDIDIVIQLTAQVSIRDIANRLGPSFRLEPQASFETISSTHRYVIAALDLPFKIELFLLSGDPHDRERFRRRKPQAIYTRTAYLPTAEDVIITKLNWARSRPHGKNAEDVRSVLAVRSEELDWNYIYGWCDQHGTRQLLDSIRQSIPPG